MPQNIVLETVQAMNTIQLSMANAVDPTRIAMDLPGPAAVQTVSAVLPFVPLARHIDTYA